MARTPTTADAFNAIAEAGRRDLLSAIGTGEVTVNDLVARTRMGQPQVSKHLGVLRAVDLVRVRSHGRHRFYRVNGAALRPVHDWVTAFERTWNERLNRLDDLLTELQEETPRAVGMAAPPSNFPRIQRFSSPDPSTRPLHWSFERSPSPIWSSAGGDSRPRTGRSAISICESVAHGGM